MALFIIAGATLPSAGKAAEAVTSTNYTDPAEALKFGQRSHWKQPWRSYIDTVPATTLLGAVGINLNILPSAAPSTARLLAANGFRRARIEVGWGTLDYDDPDKMLHSERQNLIKVVSALRDNGIRPLILLNGNHGKPCPTRKDTISLAHPAEVGATEIEISPTDVGKIVPAHTGINVDGVAASILFKTVDEDGRVKLSQPLAEKLAAGPTNVTTLLYEPFRPATLPGGSPNPRFEPTLQGWLNYVRVVTREVRSILGSDEFDVEVWNELSFGSRFLSIDKYYAPDIEGRAGANYRQILARTIELLRAPGSDVAEVGIGDGFANQSPWSNGNESPAGLTAIDKHPYFGWHRYPRDAQVNGNRPLNGRGEMAGWQDSGNQYHEVFTPTYDDFFPEHYLSAIQTESLIHDLSPSSSLIAGVNHGRHSHPAGSPPPEMWITEVNLPAGHGPPVPGGITQAGIRHVESKSILRYLVSFVNKGVTAIDFYAAKGGDMALIEEDFFRAVKASPEIYPGDSAGGETIDAVRRLTAAMGGAEEISAHRSLSLKGLTDYSSNIQFEGDGSADYPPLYNRDVFAFFPFQVTSTRFVIPIYVMTRNAAEVQRPELAASDPTRFDLPPEPYRLNIEGIDGTAATVSATDPLTGESVPVEVISGSEDNIVVAVSVTDSPRLLTIDDDGTDTGEEPTEEPPDEEPEGQVPPVDKDPTVLPDHERPSQKSGRNPSNVPGSDPATGKADSIPDLRLYLKGAKDLLRKRRMFAVARCQFICTLEARGRLKVGKIGYPLTLRHQSGGQRANPGGTALFQFEIGPEAVSDARDALRYGIPVKVSVVLRGDLDSVGIRRVHRLAALRGGS